MICSSFFVWKMYILCRNNAGYTFCMATLLHYRLHVNWYILNMKGSWHFMPLADRSIRRTYWDRDTYNLYSSIMWLFRSSMQQLKDSNIHCNYIYHILKYLKTNINHIKWFKAHPIYEIIHQNDEAMVQWTELCLTMIHFSR